VSDANKQTLANGLVLLGALMLVGAFFDQLKDLQSFGELKNPHTLGEFGSRYIGAVIGMVGAWLRVPTDESLINKFSKTIPAVLLGLALGGAVAGTPACATAPPAGTYTAPVQRQYDVTPLQQAILALSQTAVAMNAASGPTHLKDADTVLVRDFALSASHAVDRYAAGDGTLRAVVDGFHQLVTRLSVDAKNATLTSALASLQVLVDQIGVR
jgi:hypothetical protein